MTETLDKDLKKIIVEIKNKINNTKLKIFQNANISLLNLFRK